MTMITLVAIPHDTLSVRKISLLESVHVIMWTVFRKIDPKRGNLDNELFSKSERIVIATPYQNNRTNLDNSYRQCELSSRHIKWLKRILFGKTMVKWCCRSLENEPDVVAIRFSSEGATQAKIENCPTPEIIQRADEFFKNQDVPEVKITTREVNQVDSVLIDASDFRSIRGKPRKKIQYTINQLCFPGSSQSWSTQQQLRRRLWGKLKLVGSKRTERRTRTRLWRYLPFEGKQQTC